jgi:uncharacterized damage-inducible protein DinB
MTFDDLNTLLDYHYWARDRLLAGVEALTAEQFTRDLGNSFGSVRDTLAHLCDAEWVWHARWRGEAPTKFREAARHPDLASVRAEWADIESQVRDLMRTIGPEGVSRVYDYKLMSGAPGSTPFWQMLQHVVNHGTYHRGQITTMLRQLGVKPPQSQDMIFFYREQSAKAQSA